MRKRVLVRFEMNSRFGAVSLTFPTVFFVLGVEMFITILDLIFNYSIIIIIKY